MQGVATSFMAAHGVPGLSVAVAHQGEMLYERGFGFADRQSGAKVTPSSLFRIASVSKPITAVAIFDLVEQKKVGLEDVVFGSGGVLHSEYAHRPLKKWVDEIRLWHLLTHTSGGWTNDASDPMFQKPKMDQRELIAWAIDAEPLRYPPGQHFAYSNFGYYIAGRIIEKLTGRPYADHVRERILSRCGVTDMRIGGNTEAERVPEEVVYYGQRRQNPYDMNVRRMDSHGGWIATAADLVRFVSHVDGFSDERDILKAEAIREMTSASTANPHYAKGWSVNESHNWWHTGSLPGTTSIMVRTGSGFCWAGLANSQEAGTNTGEALDRMMWELVRQVPRWKA